MEKINFSVKLVAIIVAIDIAVIIMFVFGFNGVKNRAIAYEEQIETAQSDIKVHDTWVVEWTCFYGEYVVNTKQCFQAFTDKDEAEEFAESIRRAHKLIGNTRGTQVTITKSQNVGL